MEEQPKRKRTKTNDAVDVDDKKRGRPRVEKQDESAADRRRTQIRMAQRAYRQRKESTLEDLRKRVSDLTNTIEMMNKLFEDCRDRIYASNLPEPQVFHLHETAAEFEALVKEARHPNDDQLDEGPKSTSVATATIQTSDISPPPANVPKNVPSWIDQSAVASNFNRPQKSSAEIGMGYVLSMPENEDQPLPLTFGGYNPDLVGGPSSSQKLPAMPHGDTFDLFRSELPENPTLSIPGSLSPPITYSFQETSIARRIHRACAEAAYQLILDPRRRPAEFEQIFRLTLLGRDREKVAASLKSVLDRGPHEELDFWEAPLIHVGGAGTHYPRKDAFGNIIPRKHPLHVGIIGPQALAQLENASRDRISVDMTVELAGFEGEWLDPYDVQGYLEEKGIFIDPTSSFAEAEIVEWPQGPNTGSTPSSQNPITPPSGLASPDRSTPLTGTQIEKLINEADADFGQWNEFSNMQLTAVGYSDAASGSWMNFIQPGEGINTAIQQSQVAPWEGFSTDFLSNKVTPDAPSSKQAYSPQPRRRNVIIDVSKLVKVMTISGVCLGRAPGFRRRDVDRALAISSFDAF